MAFSAIENIYLLTQPVLLVVGEKADFRWQTDCIFNALPGKDKEAFIIPCYSHIDLYDKEEAVNPAVEKSAEFFTRTLAEWICLIRANDGMETERGCIVHYDAPSFCWRKDVSS